MVVEHEQVGRGRAGEAQTREVDPALRRLQVNGGVDSGKIGRQIVQHGTGGRMSHLGQRRGRQLALPLLAGRVRGRRTARDREREREVVARLAAGREQRATQPHGDLLTEIEFPIRPEQQRAAVACEARHTAVRSACRADHLDAALEFPRGQCGWPLEAHDQTGVRRDEARAGERREEADRGRTRCGRERRQAESEQRDADGETPSRGRGTPSDDPHSTGSPFP